MPLQSGSRLGVYEIVSPLGAGGMGEVYLARDTKLNRDVAIKVLLDAFAQDGDRVARFRREAQVLAALNHPHIAAIYGFEDSGEVSALVLEFVDGQTLAERLAQGSGLTAHEGPRLAASGLGQREPSALSHKPSRGLPLAEALAIARQIAEALEAAHEKGIIHRDLKPANVKLTADGKVKVLDFGLAKMLETDASASSMGASMSPTLSLHATYAGVILGTAAYMSPEQARGRPVDTRTDLWAFGCVLYEMLTGQQIFPTGETVSDAIAAILTREPDWSALPPATPDSVRRLLRRCLDKDRTKRLHSASDARLEIDDAHADPERAVAVPVVAPAPSRTRERIVWISALALVTIGAVMGTFAWVRARALAVPPPAETRLEIATPATSDPFSFAVSPDGRRVVFAASASGGVSQLWLRPLEAVSAQPLAGTEGASYPFWSPDSRSVGFFAGSALKRIDIGGGQPQTLATSSANRGGTWSVGGVILFAPSVGGPLSRVPAAGGDVVTVTKVSAGQAGHRFPQFLPGGRQFLFYANGSDEVAGVYLGSLDAPDVKRVTASDTAGAYAPSAPGPAEAFRGGGPRGAVASSEGGWLLFTREGTLIARRFDAIRGELTGDPVTVADQVGVDSSVFIGAFSVSTTGLVTYRTGGTAPNQLTWFDRAGKALGTLGAPDSTQFDPALSPDGRRVAISRVAGRNTDIWLIDAARTTRFTFDPSTDRYPRWSSDGSRIVFSNNRKGVFDLYQKPSNGAGAEAVLLESPQTKWAQSWSPDGRFLLYGASFPKTNFDQWVLPIAGDGKPFPLLNSTFQEGSSAYSPDGHWVAYASNESGRGEIYVRPFPGPGGQWQVSTSGGSSLRWRLDGKELYYISSDRKLMAVPIIVKGAALEPGLPVALFQPQIAALGAVAGYLQQYDVAPDGRFLINITTDDGGTAPITVIQNWTPKQ